MATWADELPEPLGREQLRADNSGPSKAFCVRTCDGHYFPVNASAGMGNIDHSQFTRQLVLPTTTISATSSPQGSYKSLRVGTFMIEVIAHIERVLSHSIKPRIILCRCTIVTIIIKSNHRVLSECVI